MCVLEDESVLGVSKGVILGHDAVMWGAMGVIDNVKSPQASVGVHRAPTSTSLEKPLFFGCYIA